jgi:hypothetical protein
VLRNILNYFSLMDLPVDPMRERRMQSSRLQAELAVRLHGGVAIVGIAVPYLDRSVCTT